MDLFCVNCHWLTIRAAQCCKMDFKMIFKSTSMILIFSVLSNHHGKAPVIERTYSAWASYFVRYVYTFAGASALQCIEHAAIHVRGRLSGQLCSQLFLILPSVMAFTVVRRLPACGLSLLEHQLVVGVSVNCAASEEPAVQSTGDRFRSHGVPWDLSEK